MAVRTVKARVELDGEKEYKQALAELNSGNKTLASEMRKLQAEYQGNSESIEFLTKKGELLERQLLQQKDKVETLRQAVQKSAEQYGEADERTQKWIRQLNYAEAQEFDLTHAIDENNSALANNGQEMVSLSDAAQKLADKFGITLPDNAKKALDSMGELSAGTVAKMAVAAAAVAAVIKVVKELGEITLQVAADVDEYMTESQITGVPTEMLQAWDYAAPLIDTDADIIKNAMTKLTKAMGEAQDGSEAAAENFAELGVSITDEADGSLRSAEDVFYDVVDALGQMENGTERDAAAMALMGKNAQELNPLINAGSKALKEYGEEAEEVGYILSDEQVKALSEVDDAYQRLQMQIEANRKQLAADFAPAAKDAMELFSDVVQKAGEWLKRSGLIENLAAIISSLIDILRTAGEMLSGLPGFTNALDGLKVVLGAIADFVAVIADGFDLIKSILTLNWSGVTNALGFGYSSGNANNLQRTRMQQEGTWQQYTEFYGRNATGNDNWRGGLTWVGEAGPELVSLPGGSQILNAQDSRYAGNTVFYVTIDAKSVREFNDIVEMCRNAEMERRMK